LTAAAGITLDTSPLVLAAGATTVAVSAAIFRADDPAAEFRRWMVVLGEDDPYPGPQMLGTGGTRSLSSWVRILGVTVVQMLAGEGF